MGLNRLRLGEIEITALDKKVVKIKHYKRKRKRLSRTAHGGLRTVAVLSFATCTWKQKQVAQVLLPVLDSKTGSIRGN